MDLADDRVKADIAAFNSMSCQKSRHFDQIVSFPKAKIVGINEIPGSAKHNCSNRETR